MDAEQLARALGFKRAGNQWLGAAWHMTIGIRR